jgi:hypothetical protein
MTRPPPSFSQPGTKPLEVWHVDAPMLAAIAREYFRDQLAQWFCLEKTRAEQSRPSHWSKFRAQAA